MEIALISEDLFKENSPVKEDTMIGKFVPYIVLAQKRFIRNVIGIAVYTELQSQIKAAQTWVTPAPYPITDENKMLLLEIAPALSFYAVYLGLPFHWAEIVNKGVTIRKSDNSEAVGIDDIAQLRRWMLNDADFFKRELEKFLGGCSGDYPLYRPENCDSCNKSTDFDDDLGVHIPS